MSTISRSRAVVVVAATALATTISVVTPAGAAGPIPDAALASCVAKAAGKDPAALVAEDLALVKELICNSAGVDSLAGAQHLTSATVIRLAGNNVTDLSPLAGLPELRELTVDRNPITSLAALGKLGKLERLDASQANRRHPGMPSLTGVEGFPALKTLTVNNNSALVDITAVAALPALGAFNATNGQIKDLGALASVPTLTKVYVSYNRLVDATPLAALPNLTDVDLGSNQLYDVSRLPQWDGAKATNQKIAMPDVPVGRSVDVPSPVAFGGAATKMTTVPDGVVVEGNKVTYPAPGTYVWKFAQTAGPRFDGTVTVQAVAETAPVLIKDPALSACIARSLALPEDTVLSSAQLATMTSLTCPRSEIRSLQGAEHLTGLTRANLDGNHIVDVTPLRHIPYPGPSVRNQSIVLSEIEAGTTGELPALVNHFGTRVRAVLRSNPGVVAWSRYEYKEPGTYHWDFSSMTSDFTGTITQPVRAGATPTPEPSAAPTATVTVTAAPEPAPTVTVTQPAPTVTVTQPAPTVTPPGPTVTVTASAAPGTHRPALRAPYEVPGLHYINGRSWMSVCEPYSRTIRCRTDIWSKQVVRQGGKYVVRQGWFFNNLSYLPYLTKQQWAGNPLGRTGTWTAAGRQWRTDCETAVTGRNACRSAIRATTVVATPEGRGRYSYRLVDQWVFNNMVRFRP